LEGFGGGGEAVEVEVHIGAIAITSVRIYSPFPAVF